MSWEWGNLEGEVGVKNWSGIIGVDGKIGKGKLKLENQIRKTGQGMPEWQNQSKITGVG